MSDSSDLIVSDSVAMCEECRRDGGRVDRDHAPSKQLDIWGRFQLQSQRC